MVNTMDSMTGYRTERYKDFGYAAARLDDAANYIPARLTAFLMALSACLARHDKPARSLKAELRFIRRYGPQHASPNSGYPEAALAGILDCRFGGPHEYFGKSFPKPYIGTHDRALRQKDLDMAVRINRKAEILMLLCGIALSFV